MRKIVTVVKPLVEMFCRTVISLVVLFYLNNVGLDWIIITVLTVLFAFWSALPSIGGKK